MKTFILLSFALCFLAIGCSSSQYNPVSVHQENETLSGLPSDFLKNEYNIHKIVGEWEANFDFSKNTASLTQTRNLTQHINATPLIPSPSLHINSYDPGSGLVDVDVTLSNPSSINVYDVRLIIFRDDMGTSLLNPDDWTALYDISQGWPINPFKAYCKSSNQRIFSTGSHTENLILFLPPGTTSVLFAVDVSYPGNCTEPYEISEFVNGRLLSRVGATSTARVTIKDWQSDVNYAALYCPSILGNDILTFQHESSDIWKADIVNETGAQPGEYTGYIITRSSGSGSMCLFDNVTIVVESDNGWAVSYGGSDKMDGDDIILDQSNNIYVNGFFSGSVDFNPGSGQAVKNSVGATDCYLLKLDPFGNYLWSCTWGSSAEDYASGSNIDSAGNIYVCGRYSGSCDFDPGPGSDVHTSKGGWDCFLSKFTSEGQFIWARTWGSSTSIMSRWEFCGDINFDKSGNVFGTGHFMGSVDFDPGSGTYTRSSRGDTDIYVIKLDPDGNFIMVNTWGGTQEDQSIELHADKMGNIFVSGFFKGSFDFNPGTGVDIHSSNGDFDVFVSKYDSLGEYLWTVTWGGSQGDEDRVIYADDGGNISTAGFFRGTVDFDPGEGIVNKTAIGGCDIFLLKLDSNGNFIWVRTWGGSDNEHVYGAVIDPYGDFVVSGFFYGYCDFNPSESTDYRQSVGAQDIFISKYDCNGDYLWTRTYGSSGEDVGGGIITDQSGDIYETGRFEKTIDFNPGTGIDEHTSLGATDTHVVKLLPDGYY